MQVDHNSARRLFYKQTPVCHQKLDEQLILEGAYLYFHAAGEVNIGEIKRTGESSYLSTLRPDDVQTGSKFGFSVSASLDAEYIVVGSPNYRILGAVHGCITLFKRTAPDKDFWEEVCVYKNLTDPKSAGFFTEISDDGQTVVTLGVGQQVGKKIGTTKHRYELTILHLKDNKLKPMFLSFSALSVEKESYVTAIGVNKGEVYVETTDAKHWVKIGLDNFGDVVTSVSHF